MYNNPIARGTRNGAASVVGRMGTASSNLCAMGLCIVLPIVLEVGCDAAPKPDALAMKTTLTGIGWTLSFELEHGVRPEDLWVLVPGETELRRPTDARVDLVAGQPASDLWVHYRVGSETRGPLVFHFDPVAGFIAYSKASLLDGAAVPWVSWDLTGPPGGVWFPVLLSHACGLRTVEYGFDGDLDREWAVPGCTGLAMEPFDGSDIMVEAPPEAGSVSIRLTFRDGERSEVHEFPRP